MNILLDVLRGIVCSSALAWYVAGEGGGKGWSCRSDSEPDSETTSGGYKEMLSILADQ
jgi:hypothetical protein